MTPNALLVEAYLLTHAIGKANAVKIKTIGLNLGLSHRAIEIAKEELIRAQRQPVCSETRTADGHKPGYFIATSPEEMAGTYAQTEARIRQQCITRALLRKMSLAMFGVKPARQLSFLDGVAT